MAKEMAQEARFGLYLYAGQKCFLRRSLMTLPVGKLSQVFW